MVMMMIKMMYETIFDQVKVTKVFANSHVKLV